MNALTDITLFHTECFLTECKDCFCFIFILHCVLEITVRKIMSVHFAYCFSSANLAGLKLASCKKRKVVVVNLFVS